MPKRKPIVRYLRLFGGALIGAAIGLFFAIRDTPPERMPNDLVLGWPLVLIVLAAALLVGLAFALGVFLTVVMHESGHLIAGLSHGFRFTLFVAGPLQVTRDGDKINVGLNRSLPWIGGLAACVPVELNDLTARMAAMAAGGPIASLVAGLLFWLISRWLQGWSSTVFFVLAMMSFVAVIFALIPLRSGQFYSDGSRLLMFWRNRPAMDLWARTAALASLALSDLPPHSWPKELVEEARSTMDSSLDGISIAKLLYYQAIDSRDDRAATYLDHFLDHRDAYPEPLRTSLHLEGAYFEGAVRHRTAEARQWLNESTGGMAIDPHTRLRAEAAVLMAEGCRQEAVLKVEEALAMLDKLPRNGIRVTERRMLEDIHRA